MSRRSLATVALAAAALAACRHHPHHARACGACATFEPPIALGTVYGAPSGQAPGTVVLTSNGIAMSVQDFVFVNGGTTFNQAVVRPPPIPFGTGQVLGINNIGIEFDFTALPFVPGEVQLEFSDQGGSENLQVNGAAMPPGELSAAPASLGGVQVSVTTAGVPGAHRGVVILRGPVKTLRIGGQEFAIDNVCARP